MRCLQVSVNVVSELHAGREMGVDACLRSRRINEEEILTGHLGLGSPDSGSSAYPRGRVNPADGGDQS